MAIIKSVKNSHSSIKSIVNYVTKKEKTIGQKLCSGFNCNPNTATREMQATKKLYGKSGGRTYKHFVQSFPPNEQITPQQAHELAREFVESCPLFEGFEVLYCTHVDREHIHTHFVINSVSFTDGHKFQMSKKDLEGMKILNNKLCMEHGFSVLEIGKKKDTRGIIAYDMNKYQFLKKAQEGKVKSYIQDCAVAVFDSMQESSSKEEFVASMSKRGYTVDWSDSRKYIVFTNAQGQKVRDRNLRKTYNIEVGKDELTTLFRERTAQKESPSRHRGR